MSVSVKVALRAPVASGVNAMEELHDAPDASVVPQVVPEITNSLLFVPEITELTSVTPVVELLVIVNAIAAAVELIATFPKGSGVGDTVTLSRITSTAPKLSSVPTKPTPPPLTKFPTVMGSSCQ